MKHNYKPGAFVKIKSNLHPGKHFIGHILKAEGSYYTGVIITTVPKKELPVPGNNMAVYYKRVLGIADHEPYI